MQIVELALEHPNFFCPITGKRITGDEEYNRSPAQIGLFISEVPDDPEIYDPSLQSQWDAYLAKVEASDDFLSIADFLRGINNSGWVAFAITTSGIACGPVSSTAWYVFNVNCGSLFACI